MYVCHLVSAVGTYCLHCEVQGEAEETAYDVNVALEQDSLPGPLLRGGTNLQK